MNEIPHQWLREVGTPAEFERAHLESTAAAFNLPVEKVAQKFAEQPLGSMTDAWRSFVQQLGEGDELWFFSSSDGKFAKKLGCQGYTIVREGSIRETIITLRS
jgi:hypothetical protein